MEAKQNIYYALGILAYAIAKSDGEVQDEEREEINRIANDEMGYAIDFQYADIIFQLLERDKLGFENVYEWAIRELKKGRHYLSPEIKQQLISTIEKIAEAFDGISQEENSIITRFKNDLENIGSDHYLK